MSLAFLIQPIDSKQINARKWRMHASILCVAFLAGLWLRAQYIDFASNDYSYFLSNWVLYIREKGLLSAFGDPFHNYAPLYIYMLGLMDAVSGDASPIYTIKYLTFIGELYAAFWMYRIVALHFHDQPYSIRPALAVAALWLCPSVVINGSATGQCDIWLTGFMLASLCEMMRGHSRRCLLYGTLAFAFKPQAIFLSPLLLVFLLRKKIVWQQLWIVPAMYVAICVPAWLEGRPMMDMLLIYWVQIRGSVSHNAANPYFYFRHADDTMPVIHMGEALAALVAGALVAITFNRWKASPDPLSVMLLATLFACVMPYMLPFMHDRYFFMAEIFSLLLCVMKPRWFALPLLLQSTSLMVQPYSQIPPLGGLLGWIQSRGFDAGIMINAVAIATLLWLCYQHLWKQKAAL